MKNETSYNLLSIGVKNATSTTVGVLNKYNMLDVDGHTLKLNDYCYYRYWVKVPMRNKAEKIAFGRITQMWPRINELEVQDVTDLKKRIIKDSHINVEYAQKEDDDSISMADIKKM